MNKPVKNHPTIGCCGIDCGLCPRYYTDGKSRCPGCAGKGFYESHPGCGLITCCVGQKGLENCGLCPDFPCDVYQAKDILHSPDSFVTHRRIEPNLYSIRDEGLEAFLEQQQRRMEILIEWIEKYDEGRSKSFYCLSCALIPINDLIELAARIRDEITPYDGKVSAESAKRIIHQYADREGIVLKLIK